MAQTSFIFGQSLGDSTDNLIVLEDDVQIKDSPDEDGFYLYIRKRSSGIKSILLTESSEMVLHEFATYALRNNDTKNTTNKYEPRILDGEFIIAEKGNYIIDSTTEDIPDFGNAFVLFVPYRVDFGYVQERHGVVDFINGGSYISIRTFEFPYADYKGEYRDNSFFIKREQIKSKKDVPPTILLESEYNNQYPSLPDTQEKTQKEKNNTRNTVKISFTNIASASGSTEILVNESDDIIRNSKFLLENTPATMSIDIVLVIDTTQSMVNDISNIKKKFIEMVLRTKKGRNIRVGVVEYRDINEAYVTRRHNLTDDLRQIGKYIKNIRVGGGGDWSEEVFAGLDVAVNEFNWKSDRRYIFLIGDAPANSPSRIGIDEKKLFQGVKEKDIKIYPYIISRKKKKEVYSSKL